jgi:hypothetical protein
MTRLTDLFNESDLAEAPLGGDGGPPVIVAAAASEHFFAVDPRVYHDVREYGCCLPPFPRCFVELRRPSRLFSAAGGSSSAAELPAAWGWFFALRAAPDLADRLDRLARPSGAPGGRPRLLDAADVAAAAGALRSRDPAAAGLDAAGRRLVSIATTALARGRGRPPLHPAPPPGGAAWALTAGLVLDVGGRARSPYGVELLLDAAGRVAAAPCFMFPPRAAREPLRAALAASPLLLFPALLAVDWIWSGGGLRPVAPGGGSAAGYLELVAGRAAGA